MKLGIIGSGKIVHDFLTIANQVPGLKIGALATTARSWLVAQKLQEKYQIPHIYRDTAELLADATVDTIYVAVPNSLHYELSKAAILAGKHVICEKPLVYRAQEARALKQLADEHRVYLIEAITNLYLENYQALKAKLATLGPVRLVSLNYTQLSSRYAAFKAGHILPVFDPEKGGGALMDLGIYNLHLAVDLLGKPDQATYYPNMQQGTDTSGVVILHYPTTVAVLVAAKDAYADTQSYLETEKGSIVINGKLNEITSFSVQYPDGQVETRNFNQTSHRMIPEFRQFVQWFDNHQTANINAQFDHSVQTLEVLEKLRPSN